MPFLRPFPTHTNIGEEGEGKPEGGVQQVPLTQLEHRLRGVSRDRDRRLRGDERRPVAGVHSPGGAGHQAPHLEEAHPAQLQEADQAVLLEGNLPPALEDRPASSHIEDELAGKASSENNHYTGGELLWV